VAPLGGEWTDGVVEGDLFPVGWGATLGYPAFRPMAGGAAVAVKVLTRPGALRRLAPTGPLRRRGVPAHPRTRLLRRTRGRAAAVHRRQPLRRRRAQPWCGRSRILIHQRPPPATSALATVEVCVDFGAPRSTPV
jgi:hypothetical protein